MSVRISVTRALACAFALTVLFTLIVSANNARAAEFTGKVKIAAVQTDPQFRDKSGNLEDMRTRALAAAADGADLIVFPELSLTGYKYRTRAELAEDAEPVPGPSTLTMAAVAREAKAYIAFGMVGQDGDALYDQVVLVGPEGYVGKYAKITMGHKSEAVLFTRGPSAPPVFDTSIGKIGLASCYDGAFPENARLLGLSGAQILVLIDTENGTTWRDYVRTRAVENGAYAVVSNRVGTERNSTFNGFSLIADPNYNLLANASTTAVETISATVDLGDVDKTFLSQRRPTLYRDVTRPMEPAVLGVNADPQSSVSGTTTDVDVSFATTAIPAGTEVSAEIVTAGDETIASASGVLSVDQGVLDLEVPAGAQVGVHELVVTADGKTQAIPFTVKDLDRPSQLGTSPQESASLASTLYIGFDSQLNPSTSVPISITDGTNTINLTGNVNQTVTDNRVAAPYTGLTAGTTYTASVPANAVIGTATGRGNQAFTFQFTTVGVAQTAVAAVAQIATEPLDSEANVASIVARMTSAASEGVKLLVFPELSVTGSDFEDRAEAEGVAETLSGTSIGEIAEAADTLGITVVVGLPEAAGDKLYNTLVLIGPDGVIGSHRSTHLSEDEAEIFDAGGSLSGIFDTAAGPVGLVSGYEGYFPEVVRSLSIRGALVMAGGYSETGNPWRELVRTRGSENKIYMLAANESESGGRSLIASTSRAINAELTTDAPGMAKATLNLTTIAIRYFTFVDQSTAKVRTTHYYLDRRPEIYSPISAQSESTTALTLNTGAITAGAGDVVATATVANEEGIAVEGSVELAIGGQVFAEAELVAGSASFTVPSVAFAAGAQPLTASYSGSFDLAPSIGTASVTVDQATPTLAASLASSSVPAGSSGQLNVSVNAPGIGAAAGELTATVDGKSVSGSLSDGSTSLALPSITKAGQYVVSVSYGGADLVAAAAATVNLTVTKVKPILSIKLSKKSVKPGQKTKATVRLKSAGIADLSGTVAVKLNGRTVKVRLKSGVARVTLSPGKKKSSPSALFTFSGNDSLSKATKRVKIAVK